MASGHAHRNSMRGLQQLVFVTGEPNPLPKLAESQQSTTNAFRLNFPWNFIPKPSYWKK